MSLPYFPVIGYTIMLSFIENVLCHFETCFSRKSAFRWFVGGILLPLLVKVHAEAGLLPEERGACAHGTGGRGKTPPESTGSRPCH